jgi:hypothetical protein
MSRRLLAVLRFSLFAPAVANGQATMSGVLRDSVSRAGIPGVEVAVPAKGLRTTSDSSGFFRLDSIPLGTWRVLLRKPGFDSIAITVPFDAEGAISRDFFLTQLTRVLPTVPVRATSSPTITAKLVDFERRRLSGPGRFLTASQIESARVTRTGDLIQRLSGTRIVRGRGMQACVVSARGSPSPSGNSFLASCGGKTIARTLCPVAVYLDGIPVYRGGGGQDLFDVNSVQPSELVGVEFYAGPAQTPVEFNATSGTCATLLLWTK